MKVAILQDWLLVNGGAEKVLRAICELYPDADVFSLIDQLEDEDRKDITQGRESKTTFLNRLPGIEGFYRKLLPLYPLAVGQIDLSEYDLIISSSYSVIKNVRKKKGQIHICYCHSPMRYAYDLRESYLKTLPIFLRPLANWILSRIAIWDKKRTSDVDAFVANSNYVAERIQRIYNREAKVIYPPIDIDRWKPKNDIGEAYYVTASRLVAYKNVGAIIEAFALNNHRKLVVLGDGPMRTKWEEKAPPNVVFKGHLDRNQQIEWIQNAKALIVAADEDFGITPVEAQAAGVPVVALRKGGYLETVIEDETGVFFNEPTADQIIKAIKRLDEIAPLDRKKLVQNASRFDVSRFKSEFLTLVSEKVSS